MRRKRYAIVLLTFMMCALAPLFKEDAHSNSAAAQSTAILNLEPQIFVQPKVATIELAHSGMGLFEVTAEFMVEANTNQVSMYVQATDFHFEGNPGEQGVEAIHLDIARGVTIEALGANFVDGGNPLPYQGEGDSIDGFPSQKTQTVFFQSSESHSFRHDVDVIVAWNQDKPLQPAGQYVAKIKLVCTAIPPGS